MTDRRWRQALLGLVAALAIGEGIARLHGDQLCSNAPGQFVVADATLGWRRLPHLRATVGRCGDAGTPSATFETNAQGMRDPERPEAKPPGTFRILLLGGSLFEGVGVRRDQSLAGYLEQWADARRGPRLEVINATVGDWALDQMLVYYRTEGRRYQPDLVLIAMDPIVDTQGLSPSLVRDFGLRVADKPYFRVTDGVLSRAPQYQFLDDQRPTPEAASGPLAWSQLYRLAVDRPRLVGQPIQHVHPPALVPEYDAREEDARAFALAATIAGTIAREAWSDGAQAAVVLGPVLREGAPRFGTLTEDVRLVRRLAEQGLVVANLGPAFAEHRREKRGSGYFGDSLRLDREGHHLAAQTVWYVLSRDKLMPAVERVRTFDAGRVALGPGGVLAGLWDARHGLFLRTVAWGALAVALLWVGSALPSSVVGWWNAAVGVGLGAALAPPELALGVALLGLVTWAIFEGIPRRAALVVVVLPLAALVVLPPVWAALEPPMADLERRTWLAFVTNVLLLRLIGYVVDRHRGGPRLGLRDLNAAIWFPPTLTAGPIVDLHAAARGIGGAPRLGVGLAWVVAAITAHGLARFVLNTPAADVYVTGGAAFGRARLWLWVVELGLHVGATWAAWSWLAQGFAHCLGVSIVSDWPLPRRVTDARDLWRVAFVSVGAWMRRFVYVPAGGGRRAATATTMTFVVAAAWAFWWGLKQLGPATLQSASAVRFGLWAGMNVVAVLGARGAARLPGLGGRCLGLATLVLALLSWVPFMSPVWNDWRLPVAVLARLLGLR